MLNINKKMTIFLVVALLFTTALRTNSVFAADATNNQEMADTILQGNSGIFTDIYGPVYDANNPLSTKDIESNTKITILKSTPTVLKILNKVHLFHTKLFNSYGDYICTVGIPVYSMSGNEIYFSGIPSWIDGDINLFDSKGNSYSGNQINAPFSYDDKGNITGFIEDDYSPSTRKAMFEAIIHENMDQLKYIQSCNNAMYPQITLFSELDAGN